MLGVNAEVEEDIQKLSDGICALTMTHRQGEYPINCMARLNLIATDRSTTDPDIVVRSDSDPQETESETLHPT